MTEILLIVLVILVLVNIVIGLRRKLSVDIKPQMREVETSLVRFEATLDRMENSIRDEFQRNRNESSERAKSNREEQAASMKSFEEKFTSGVKELQLTIEKNLRNIREDNDKQLGEMRKTVDEKLQSTLEKRLGESFKQVSERLEQVHKGLGEMQTIASGVGDLKKVLSNVKTRGVLGEYQLGNILEQILTVEQYSKNVATKKGSQANVEYAIKMPGTSATEEVWMPVDSKFPIEPYEVLLAAYDQGNPEAIEAAQKVLIRSVEGFAKEISEKYIDPPHTTDFGIMFFPIESLYAEVLRHSGLFETLQRKYKITVTGPTTLSALLNSLQMGFRTLAVQKRSSEVWSVLGAVKSEFSKFSEQLGKVQKQIHTASGSLDTLRNTRTNQIERRLRSVESLDGVEAGRILELPPDEEEDEPKDE
ncbi:MAG: DNA recombination protein RmuC [Bacteroidetes bacterium]|nr:DNA recombination protein RmuC [Bacteroidota bacterium]